MTEIPPKGETAAQFPRVYGRYLLIRLLSRGGMGEVYLAKTGQITGFEKIVVIKKILPSLSSNPEFSKKFISEAQIAIKLNHVNIVPVLEVGRIEGEFFIAMDYVEGMDLRRIMSKLYRLGRTMPPDFALLIARDLLTGLSYAHRRKDEHGRPLDIVHCDISPPNVLVSYEGEVKIIDFGVAKSALATDEDTTQLGFGKFGYMAPEQILKGKEVDARTDIYSAGVVLWELLTGQRMLTFSSTTPFKEIAKKVVLEPPVPPSQVNPELDERFDSLVLKAIAKHPEDRYQTAAEFRNEVQKLLAELNPTITNDDLGEFIRELFAEEIEEARQLIREAKAIDIHEFEDELTEAMEKTVSFAVGEELPGGAVGDVVLLPTPQGTRAQSGPLTQRVSLLDPRLRRPLLYITVGLVLLAAVIWSVILLQRGSAGGVRMMPFEEPLLVEFVVIPETKVVTITKPAPPPSVPAPMVTPPMRPSVRTMRPLYRRTKRPKRPQMRRQAASKPAQSAPQPQPQQGQDTAQLRKRLRSLFIRVKREYNAFKETHGDVLSTQWAQLIPEVIKKLRSSSVTPGELQDLINRLQRFRHKMQRY